MWNECGGGRRYSSDDDEHSRQQRRTAIEDQQQLDAVSALALFSQTGYSSPSSRAAPVGSQDLGVHRYPSQPLSAAAATAAYPQHPQSGSMGRHFSDTLSQNPTASSEYGVRQYHRSESEPPQRAPRNVAPHQPTQYYHHETSETSGLGSYHQASISTYREPSEVTLGSYRRGPSNYEDDYHRRTEMNATRRADFHRSQGHDDDRRASSGPVSAYPRRHEAVASELLARGPTTYGRQLLPLSSYHQEEGAGRGPRLSSSCSFPLDEHQGRNPEGRGRPYAPPSRYHGDLPNDHDRSYCDITFRQPIVLLNNDHHGTGGFPSEQRHNTEDGDDNNVTALKHRSQHPRPYHRSVDGAEVEELPYHRNASTSAPLYDQTEFPTYKSGLQHVRTEPGDTVEALDKHRDSAQLRPGLREAQDINSEKSEHCQQQASGKVPANDGRPMDQRESYTGYVVKRPNQQGEAQGSLIQNEAFAHDWKANVEEIASVPIRPTQGEHAKGTTQPGLVLNDSQVEKESEENSDDHENVELDGDEEGESAGSEEVLDDNCSQDHVYAEAQKVQTLVPAARGKPEAAARALAAAKFELDREKEGERRKEKTLNFYTADPPKKKSPIKSVSSKKSPTKRLNSRTNTLLPNSLYSSILTASSARREFLLGETVPAIKEAEYENLQELMTQLCRVPLLAEFSRPVSILHPEVRRSRSSSSACAANAPTHFIFIVQFSFVGYRCLL